MIKSTDYTTFGAPMPGRSYSSTTYRYGFNGKENDAEANSTGQGTQDYGLRIYNPSLGRFLSIDPLTKSYPWNSTYCFAENDVIRCADLDGAERWVRTTVRCEDGAACYSYEYNSEARPYISNGNSYDILYKVITPNGDTRFVPRTNWARPSESNRATEELANHRDMTETNLSAGFTFEFDIPRELVDPGTPIPMILAGPLPVIRTDPTISGIVQALPQPTPTPVPLPNLNITFQGSSADFSNRTQANAQIAPLVAFLNANPTANINLAGNAGDPTGGTPLGSGSATLNSPVIMNGSPSTVGLLMVARAEATKGLLIANGINPSRVTTSTGTATNTVAGRNVGVTQTR